MIPTETPAVPRMIGLTAPQIFLMFLSLFVFASVHDSVLAGQKAMFPAPQATVGQARPDTGATWQTAEILLPLDDNDCLVYDIHNGRCIVDAAAFNVTAMPFTGPRTSPLDSLRTSILNQLLFVRYWNSAGVRAGFDSTPEILESIRQATEAREKYYAGIDISAMDSMLQTLYVDYYDRFFATDTTRMFSLIGSTDTSWVDSVYRSMKAADSIDPHRIAIANPTTHGNPGAEITKTLLWQTMRFPDLPETLQRGLGYMEIGAYAAPIKTPFGSFICRYIGRESSSEISYGAIKGMLFTLYQKHLISMPKTFSDNEIRSYYAAHQKDFVRENCHIAFRLVPSLAKVVQKQAGAMTTPAGNKIIRSKSVNITLDDLPAAIRSLVVRLHARNGKKDFTDVQTVFGTASVTLLDSLKSIGPIPFEQVRDQVILSLQQQQMIDVRKYEKATLGFIHDRTIAHAYFSSLSETTPRPTDAEIAHILDSARVSDPEVKRLSDLSKSEKEQFKMQLSFFRATQPYAAWQSSLFVDTKKLFEKRSVLR